jgi:hypothetical protein
MTRVRNLFGIAGLVWTASILVAPDMRAGAHTWDVNEVFMNADGTIWFIELREANGTPNETSVAGRPVRSLDLGNSFLIGFNLTPPTSNKHLLFASPAFAALPGAPPPDKIVNVPNFFDSTGDRVQYDPYDTFTFGAVPTDGINSMNKTGAPQIRPNSPTNYAGQTGSVNANPASPPPGVPDGTAGSNPVRGQRLTADGSSIQVSWDTLTCSSEQEHVIVWGAGNDLPSAPGGPFSVSGGVCGIGNTGEFTWSPTPTIADALLWWLVVAQDDSGVEGSWGVGASGERTGPGPDGSSGQCGATDRDLANDCGH